MKSMAIRLMLRCDCQMHGWYVLAVRTNITVWLKRPEMIVPEWTGRGHKPFKEQVADEAVQPKPVSAVVACWPESQWRRFGC